MKKNQYDELLLRIVFYVNEDVIAASAEGEDDLGEWKDDWFSPNND